ncbi:hypothetical protein [Micromonospora sp. HK10]|uniref:hypothetical protein n=1 Tax=Micromonospora sp. HK10 TaxID=1538294 RepID=UPI000A8CD7D5|nr:hypothetical protein [Micromonospora sp. HK10]
MRVSALRRWMMPSLCGPLLFLTLFALAACGKDEPADRAAAEALLCLSPAERPAVARAAVLLRLATAAPAADQVHDDGRDWPLEEWRGQHREDFARACGVAVAAAQLDEGGTGAGSAGSTWKVLWPLLVGAALTLLTTTATTGWREWMTEVRKHSAALRTDARAFVTAVIGFMDAATDASRPVPRGETLDDLRTRLQLTLAETPRPDRHPEVGRMLAELDDGALGSGLTAGWSTPEVRRPQGERAVRVRSALDDLRAGVRTVAEARERPIRAALLSRRRHPTPPPAVAAADPPTESPRSMA